MEQVGSEGGRRKKLREGRIEHWRHRKSEFPEIAKKFLPYTIHEVKDPSLLDLLEYPSSCIL